jgi:hypothetical protein
LMTEMNGHDINRYTSFVAQFWSLLVLHGLIDRFIAVVVLFGY